MEEVLCAQIHPVGDALAVFFADHKDGVPLAVDGEVARHAEGFEQGDLVFGDHVLARTVHLAQDGVVEVHELDGHYGIVDEVLVHQPLLDEGGNLALGHAGHVETAQDGKVDVAFGVEGIAGHIAAAVLT